mgnify:CR=1 FL=1
MKRQATGLLTALCTLALAGPAFAIDARIRGQLEKLTPEERLEQRCDMEAMDRIGLENHTLSKRAKDLGSAAVLLALLFCGAVWVAALVARFG